MCIKHFDKKNCSDSVFVIMNTSEYVVQQRDFVDFQMELFIKTDSFELISIDCH